MYIFTGDRHECKSFNPFQIWRKSMAVVIGGPLHMRPWRQEAHFNWGRCENGPIRMTLTTRGPLHMRSCWKQAHFMRPWWLGTHYTCPWWQGIQFMKMLIEILSVCLSTSRSTTNTRFGQPIPNICLPTISVHVYISSQLLHLKRHSRKSQSALGLRIQEVPCSNIVIRSSL